MRETGNSAKWKHDTSCVPFLIGGLPIARSAAPMPPRNVGKSHR